MWSFLCYVHGFTVIGMVLTWLLPHPSDLTVGKTLARVGRTEVMS